MQESPANNEASFYRFYSMPHALEYCIFSQFSISILWCEKKEEGFMYLLR